MNLKDIQQLVQKGEKVIVVDQGKPVFVVMDYDSYCRQNSAKSDDSSHGAGSTKARADNKTSEIYESAEPFEISESLEEPELPDSFDPLAMPSAPLPPTSDQESEQKPEKEVSLEDIPF